MAAFLSELKGAKLKKRVGGGDTSFTSSAGGSGSGDSSSLSFSLSDLSFSSSTGPGKGARQVQPPSSAPSIESLRSRLRKVQHPPGDIGVKPAKIPITGSVPTSDSVAAGSQSRARRMPDSGGPLEIVDLTTDEYMEVDIDDQVRRKDGKALPNGKGEKRKRKRLEYDEEQGGTSSETSGRSKRRLNGTFDESLNSRHRPITIAMGNRAGTSAESSPVESDVRRTQSFDIVTDKTPSLMSDSTGGGASSTTGHSEPPLPLSPSQQFGPNDDSFIRVESIDADNDDTDMNSSFSRSGVPFIDFGQLKKNKSNTTSRSFVRDDPPSPREAVHGLNRNGAMADTRNGGAPPASRIPKPAIRYQAPPRSVPSARDTQGSVQNKSYSPNRLQPLTSRSVFDTEARIASSPLPYTPRKPVPPAVTAAARRKNMSSPLASRTITSQKRQSTPIKLEEDESARMDIDRSSPSGPSSTDASKHIGNSRPMVANHVPHSHVRRQSFTLDEEIRRAGVAGPTLESTSGWGDILESDEYVGVGQMPPDPDNFMKGGGAGGRAVRSAF